MLEIRGLSKHFSGRKAVDDVSFAVGKGQIVGLLGPNGAGKTTTMAMIAGIARAEAGSIALDGQPADTSLPAYRRRIGLVPQDLALYDELSAAANLELAGGLYSLHGVALANAIRQALALVGLADRAHDRVARYSGGMKRRLNIAAALLHDPDLLLLDEPTVGVDPQSRNAIFSNLESLRDAGKALVYSTHYMEEAERLCSRVVILDRGRTIADDTLAGLRSRIVPAPGGNDSLETLFIQLTGRELRDASEPTEQA